MVEKVKAPVTPAVPQTTTPLGVPAPAVKGGEKAQADPAAVDALQKAAQGLLSYKSSPLMSGAFKIFSDGVVFPPHLIDSKDPRNDPKYLRLLAAVLGMDDLERYFYTLNDEQEAERKVQREKNREQGHEGEEPEPPHEEEKHEE